MTEPYPQEVISNTVQDTTTSSETFTYISSRNVLSFLDICGTPLNLSCGSIFTVCDPFLSDGGPRSAGWRDHAAPGESRRRKFDFDFRDSDGHGGGRRRAGSDGLEDDRDGLPEWCTDEEDGEMGTFDSSGAFMPMKVCFALSSLQFMMLDSVLV